MNHDIYQTVTDQIIAALEQGAAPWVRPWSTAGMPRNAVSGREYSGINLVLLAMSLYASPLWLTYNQANAAGAQVRKGEHGTTVVFYKSLRLSDVNNPESKEKSIPLLRSFTVFNVQQIDGLPDKYTLVNKPQLDSFADNDQAEIYLSKASVEYDKGRACYIPSTDVIWMPSKTDFKSIQDCYATSLHELIHWTGNRSRLARDFNGRFGDAAYAFEELIAELGAAFLCAHCNIDGQLQHASYIQSWLKVLKSDKRAIFTAAAAARKASEYVTGKQEDEQQAA